MCDNIHLMITDQIQKLQASLEMSRERIPREVRIPIFDLLRDYVTSECFTLLWDNYTNARARRELDVCLDSYWREVYGVPCVHDFMLAIQARRPISLKQIHPFWKQVHWIPADFSDDDFDNDDDDRVDPSLVSLNRFRERMDSNSLSPEELERMASCFEDIENPGSTTMKEPAERVKAKGRPPTKKSTRRDPSSFERSSTRGPGRPRGPVDTPYDENYQWVDREFRKFMEPYVLGAREVLGDGHCGYRAIVVVLGRPDEDYLMIRSDMVKELTSKRSIYSKVII